MASFFMAGGDFSFFSRVNADLLDLTLV